MTATMFLLIKKKASVRQINPTELNNSNTVHFSWTVRMSHSIKWRQIRGESQFQIKAAVRGDNASHTGAD